MRKTNIISIILTIALMISLIHMPVFAEELQAVTISSEESLKAEAGKNITVPIYISNNNGMAGYVLEFSYNNSLITPQEIIRGEIFQSGNFENNLETADGKLKVVWNHSESVSENGLLFSIVFKVSDDTKESCKIDIDYSSTYDVEAEEDGDLTAIDLDCKAITLTMEHVHQFTEWEIVKKATCVEEGQKKRTCSECGETEEETLPIDPEGHIPNDAVKENEIAPTSETNGQYDEVVYCSLCGAEISRKTVIISELVNKESLQNAVDEALADLSNTRVSINGRNIDDEEFWVGQEAADGLVKAVKEALAILVDTSSSEEDVETAVSMLQDATTEFDTQKQLGTKSIAASLELLLTETEELINNVLVSENGEEFFPTQIWVNQSTREAFEECINDAKEIYETESATYTDLTAAISMLQDAKTSFEDAEQPGTRVTDKEELRIAIEEANSKKDKAVVSEDGTDVESTKYWADQETTDQFEQAIKAAEEIYNAIEVSDEMVEQAVSDLKKAQNVFVSALNVGLKASEVVNREELSEAILDAVSAVVNVKVSGDGTDVSTENYWVTQETVDEMLASITDAMNVLSDTNSDQETINRATSVLEGAKTIFEEAKQKGTKNEDLIVSEIKIEPEESVMTTSKTTKTMPYSIIEESKLQLTAKIRPENAENQKLIWSSSNPNVATVDENGLVTALTYGKAVITATLEGESGLSASCTIQTRYNDVADKGKYWFNPVYWAADKGITKGYANIFFGPEENCTREQLITFLYREAGKPSVSSSDIKEYNTFSDVDAGAYYEKAVVWAAKNGITKGYSKGPYAGKFGVGLNITREDTVTFLYRMAKTVAGNEFDDVTDLDFHNKSYEFKDVAKGMYYQKAIVWAAKNSITKGYSNGENAGKFGVGFNVVRGDIVTFLYRYDRKYN